MAFFLATSVFLLLAPYPSQPLHKAPKPRLSSHLPGTSAAARAPLGEQKTFGTAKRSPCGSAGAGSSWGAHPNPPALWHREGLGIESRSCTCPGHRGRVFLPDFKVEVLKASRRAQLARVVLKLWSCDPPQNAAPGRARALASAAQRGLWRSQQHLRPLPSSPRSGLAGNISQKKPVVSWGLQCHLF